MGSFEKRWNKQITPGVGKRISGSLRPGEPLKPKVRLAIERIHKQIGKLDGMLSKLKDRDAKIFKRIVEATQAHDGGSARVLSNELAEIRKVAKVLGSARMALERIELRLATANDIGDTVSAIVPTIGLMKNLKSQLGAFMPSADKEITNMSDMLGGILQDTFTGDSTFGVDTAASEEMENILKEAAAVAETAVDGKLPSTPADTGMSGSPSDAKYF